MSYLGEKIKELRSLSNLSQAELGRRVGVQRAAIQKYEKGTVDNIPIKTLEKIAGVLDVSPAYLTGWCEESTNPLALEVRVLQGVSHFYGEDAVDLLDDFSKLNPVGRKRVFQYLEDLRPAFQTDGGKQD